MKTRIVRLGNSQGVRIPKLLLERSGLSGEVSLEVEAGRIVIHAARPQRDGWEDAFRAMAERGDDQFDEAALTHKRGDDRGGEWK